jgi:pyruvate kinase
MVTMPSEAAEGPDFALALAQRGMDCARINCAHDGPDAWRAMIAHIRRAERLTGRPCRVLMDLGGPKARTGAVLTPDGKRRLKRDDALLLARSLPAADEATPFQAVCQLPEALDQIAVGAAVWLDDGKLGTRVERLTPDGALLRVVQTPPKGYRLKAGKGLNFPDTDLRVDPLNDKDRRDLDVVAAEADMVGYSFVQSAADVANLHRELDEHQRRTGRTVAIIAKIETHRALRNLPEIIVRGAGTRPFGVMIARGDLAVEIGYQRLAEIQEEVLWLCEAAHVPVVWATQVLENFVTTGTPSRAEVTDAAMSARAECVMLNKGPYIAEGVTILDDVLTRMQAHQRKKSAQLRALHLWREPAD